MIESPIISENPNIFLLTFIPVVLYAISIIYLKYKNCCLKQIYSEISTVSGITLPSVLMELYCCV